jgi:hypothetical protein
MRKRGEEDYPGISDAAGGSKNSDGNIQSIVNLVKFFIEDFLIWRNGHEPIMFTPEP